MTDALDIAMELAMSAFRQSASPFADEEAARAIMQETGVSPFSEAALTIRELVSQTPRRFVSNQAIAALGGESFNNCHCYILIAPWLTIHLQKPRGSRRMLLAIERIHCH